MSCGDGEVDPLEDCDFGLRYVFKLRLPRLRSVGQSEVVAEVSI